MAVRGRKGGHTKAGGRQKGTPNKRTQMVMDKLKEMGCDPVEGLAKIALDDENPIELRAKCMSDLMPYAYPKLKQTDMNVNATTTLLDVFKGLAQAEA